MNLTRLYSSQADAQKIDFRVSANPAVQAGRNRGAVTSEPVGGRPKRVLDIALVLAVLPFLFIILAGLALIVKATAKGPVLYGHKRVGFNGREFRCWKFRTMVVNGDEVLRRHLQENPKDAVLWNTTRKLNDDPRVTPVGKVLRKLSLDELPQLLNVLTGDMSLVGPRPVVQDELDNYGSTAPYYLSTRPGLTGLWQVSGRSDTTYSERVRLDRQYIMNWSLAQDMTIMFKTLPALLSSRGAR